MLLFMYSTFVDWLEKQQLSCFHKSIFGIDCSGCGMQRAVIALLNGDFVASIKLYPALIPTIIMLIFLAVHIFYRLKNGAKILLWLFIFNIVVMLISYIYKLFF